MGQGEPTKLSPLFEMQKRSGATFAELAGWRMPEDYGDSEREHTLARYDMEVRKRKHPRRLKFCRSYSRGRSDDYE